MDLERELLKGNTPTLILAVLREGPLHGYAIAREIERRSGKGLSFKEGTLYPALHALEKQDWIAGEWSGGEGTRSRKTYRITPAGLAEMESRTQTWTRFADAVDRVLKGEPDGGTDLPPERRRAERPFPPVPAPEPSG